MLRLTFLSLFSVCLTAFAAEPVAFTTGSNAAPAASPAASATPALPKISWSSVHVEGPYIALTFDDGPHATNTPRLLDMLAKRHIKATFFLIGENAQNNPDIVKRIHAEGHELGNHSWTHPNLALLSDEKVRSELQRTDDAIFAAAGVHPKLMRPPYGSLALAQRRWVNKDFGYKIILWDVDPLDWKYRNSAHVESEILKQTVPGSIILSHDIHVTTVDAMPETLDALIAKGYKFVTVSELLAMEKPLPPKPAATPVKKTDLAKTAAAVPSPSEKSAATP